MRFVAGRGTVAERLVRGAAVAERHRENVAGQGAGGKESGRARRIRFVAGRSAVAKMQMAPPHSGRAAAEHHREETARRSTDA